MIKNSHFVAPKAQNNVSVIMQLMFFSQLIYFLFFGGGSLLAILTLLLPQLSGHVKEVYAQIYIFYLGDNKKQTNNNKADILSVGSYPE